MARKRKLNQSNMQKPPRKVQDNPEPLEWEEDVKNKIDEDAFRNTLTVNGDIVDSTQIDPRSKTVNISISKADLDNLYDKFDPQYKSNAKYFMGRGVYGLQNAKIVNLSEYPISPNNKDFSKAVDINFNMTQLNTDSVDAITKALGVPGEYFTSKELIPFSGDFQLINKVEEIYIPNDSDWFAVKHDMRRMPKEWVEYTEFEIAEEYEERRRIYDPYGPIWVDRHMEYEEIGAAKNLHPSLIKAMGAVEDKSTLDDILHYVRQNLSDTDQHIFARSDLHGHPTLSLFREYNALVHEIALASDHPKANKAYIKDLEYQIEYSFRRKMLTHHTELERIMGVALGARNIMVVQRPPSSKMDWPHVAMFDFDFISWPVQLKNRFHVDIPPAISVMLNKPQLFFRDTVSSMLQIIKLIIMGIDGITFLNLTLINYKEWVFDVIRYLKQVWAHMVDPREYKETILYPVPMRIMCDFAYKEPAWTMNQGIRVRNDLKPFDIIQQQLPNNKELTDIYVDLLWDEIASISIMRDSPFREELAPQLWDYTYYSSVLEPRWFLKFTGNKANIDVITRVQVLNMYMVNFSKVILSGRRKFSEGSLTVMRKEREGDMDRLGWYVAFLDKGGDGDDKTNIRSIRESE